MEVCRSPINFWDPHCNSLANFESMCLLVEPLSHPFRIEAVVLISHLTILEVFLRGTQLSSEI